MNTIKANGLCSLTVTFCLAITLMFALCSESAARDATESQHVFISPDSHAFGYSVSHAGDFNGDGLDDLIVGAPEAPPGEQAYIFYGRDESDPTLERIIFLHNANVVLTGPSSTHPFGLGSLFGRSVSGGGDFNDDGYDDVIVGAPLADGPSDEPYEGCVYIFFGGAHDRNAERITIDYSNADLTYYGENQEDMFGWSVAMVGKLNDDDMDDIVIGAPEHTSYDGFRGKIYVFHAYNTGDIRPVLSADDNAVHASQGNGMFGYSVAGIGDYNNDGYNDFAVGRPHGTLYIPANGNRAQTGWVSIYTRFDLPPPNSTFQRFSIVGGQNQGGFGYSVAAAGDVNQDGFDDLIVGAPHMESQHGEENIGFAYIILGRRTQLPFNSNRVYMWNPDDPTTFPPGVIQLRGEREYDFFGGCVGTVGDLNGDSFEDVIVGAPRDRTHGGDLEGRANIFPGREMDNDEFISVFAAEEGMTIVGEDPEDRFGSSVTGGFGWTPDGLVNAFIGAHGYGSVYLFRSLQPIFPLHNSFPISLQNNTDKIAKGSPFFQKAIDQGTIGFYFMEPGGGSEQKLQFWGEVPFDTTVPQGKSVSLPIPWPTCSQASIIKEVACSQPSNEASLFWTFKATIDGKQLYAFPENTQDPQEPQMPPLLPLSSDGVNENTFQLFAFEDESTLVGGAKIFNLMPAVAGVKINPKVINLKSKGGRIKCLINLPDGLKEKDIEPGSLRLSDPSCKNCEPIEALRGYATKKNYTASFARKDLIRLIEMQQEQRNYQFLRVSGHMKFGNFLEGDTAIKVKRNSKKENLAKK